MEGIAVPKKLYYRIGEACRAVDIQPYVLRYWETEFDALAPGKSKSGQRVYTEHELGVIRRIKELLYEEGYTIAGAKKRLQAELEDGRSFAAPEGDGELFAPEEGDDDVPVIAVEGAPGEETANESAATGDDVETAPEVVASTEASAPVEMAEPAEAPAPPAEVAIDTQPAVEARVEKSSARRATGGRAAGSRRRGAAAAAATAATETADETTARASGVGESATAASDAPAPGATAVDSPLSERVETLEHGLRRVLAEVRQLRDLLGGSTADR